MASASLHGIWAAVPRRALAAACAALLMLVAGLAAAQPIPELSRRVTDTAGLLSADQADRLEARLAAFEQRKGAQIAVLIVPSVMPASIEEYALRTFEQWKLGRRGIDDGILVLVASQDRTMRIEVGTGLEGAVPDALAGRIIRERMTPAFRAGDYYTGIDDAASALMAAVDGEPLPRPPPAPDPERVNARAVLLAVGLAIAAGLAAGSRKIPWKVWLPLAVLPPIAYVIVAGGDPSLIAVLLVPDIFGWLAGFALWRSSLARGILLAVLAIAAAFWLLARWLPVDTIPLGLGIAMACALALGLLALIVYSMRQRWKESRLGFAIRSAIWAAIPLFVGSQSGWDPIAVPAAAAVGLLFVFVAGGGSGSGGSRSGGSSGSSGSSSSPGSSGGFSGGGGSSRGGGASGSW